MSRTAKDELTHAVARIHGRVLSVVMATIFGLGLFSMTVWLLLKDDQNPGAHLELLSNYFFGYSVSWAGSIVGLVYGALLGALVGWFIGRVYNWMADVPHRPAEDMVEETTGPERSP